MLFFIDQRKIKYVHVCLTGDVKMSTVKVFSSFIFL